MKQIRTSKNTAPQTHVQEQWQTGDYARHLHLDFDLPQQFLILCKLVDKTPEDLIRDFTDNLSGGSWNREGRDQAKQHLVDYFITHGYGRELYTEQDLREIFHEMNAIGLLFPKDGPMKLKELHVEWRDEYQGYFFAKWYKKPRR